MMRCVMGKASQVEGAAQQGADPIAAKLKKFGDPKLVMLFIMRPNLCDQQDVAQKSGCKPEAAGSQQESRKRFCNGSIQTLQTAIRLSGAKVTQA